MSLKDEISSVLNSNSAENVSNTPDWILGNYLMSCLNAFDAAVQQRETWHGNTQSVETEAKEMHG